MISGALAASTGIIAPFLIPALLLLGFPSNIVRGTTLVSELLMSLVSTLIYGLGGKLDRRVIVAFAPGAVTVVLGAWMPQILMLEEWLMKAFVAVFMVTVGLMMLVTTRMNLEKSTESKSSELIINRVTTMKLMSVSVFAGLVKGFFGAGWGPMGVGLFVLMGVDPSVTIGSSLAIRILLDVTGGLTFVGMNLVNFEAVAVLALSAGIAIVPTAKLLTRTPKEKLRNFLGAILIILGCLVLFGIS